MCLKDHIKYSCIPALILYPFVGIGALYFFLAGILIDLDHCMEYTIKFRGFSVKGMFDFYQKELPSLMEEKRYLGLSIFHTLEFLTLVFILSFFFSSWLWFVWLGMMFHWVLDMSYLYNPNATCVRAVSLVEYLIKKKRYRDDNRELETTFLKEQAYRERRPQTPETQSG